MPIPPPKHQVKVYETEPPAAADTFNSGVLAKGTQNEALSIVLFGPDLQIIASLDNTDSDAECSYESSVTTGFTFGMTQSFSISATVGAEIKVVTAEVSFIFAMSFSEEWSRSSTHSMTFTCPAGKKTFLYQGTLMSRILRFDAGSGAYAWQGAAARALTQVLITRREPLVGSAAKVTQIEQL